MIQYKERYKRNGPWSIPTTRLACVRRESRRGAGAQVLRRRMLICKTTEYLSWNCNILAVTSHSNREIYELFILTSVFYYILNIRLKMYGRRGNKMLGRYNMPNYVILSYSKNDFWLITYKCRHNPYFDVDRIHERQVKFVNFGISKVRSSSRTVLDGTIFKENKWHFQFRR